MDNALLTQKVTEHEVRLDAMEHKVDTLETKVLLLN